MGSMSSMVSKNGEIGQEAFAIIPELMEQRRKDPQDDLLTGLVHAEIEEDGKTRTLTLEEILGFVQLISLAGTETVARHARVRRGHARAAPRPAPGAGRRPVVARQRGRGAAALRGAVAGAVALGRARRRAARRHHPAGRAHLAAQRFRRPRRAPLPRPRPLRHPPRDRPPARRSGTARTSASAPRWRGSKAASRCTRR